MTINHALGEFPIKLKMLEGQNEYHCLNNRTFFQKANHQPLPACNHPEDWLASYLENGETFDQYREQQCLRSGRFRGSANIGCNTIHLVQIGDVEPGLVDKIVQYCSSFFQRRVELVEPVQVIWDLSDETRRLRNDRILLQDFSGASYVVRYRRSSVRPDRRQLHVEDVLSALAGLKDSPEFQKRYEDSFCLMAVTIQDLFQSTEDLFIAGLAAAGMKVAAFSFFRYQPGLVVSKSNWDSFHYRKVSQKTEQARKVEFLRRALKLVVHELGHLFGIGHCVHYFCVMNGSGHLQEDFNAPLSICPVDLRKLTFRLNLNIVERYNDLARLCGQWSLSKEEAFFKAKVEMLLNYSQKEEII
mmetsp:Transcript_13287/g.23613  ORF Transcript_13287/g.23613 Transcript_13287/m.23613 type:complete len:358 (+) Transcript_13287:2-1075(+)